MKKILTIIVAIVMACTLSVTSFAAKNNAVPSIEEKLVPEIVPMGDDGHIAEIVGKESVTIIHDIYGNELIVTSYAKRKAETAGLSEELKTRIISNLEQALNEVRKANSLGELNVGLDEIAKKYNPSYDASMFYATDLFDITIADLERPEYIEEIKSGNKLKITFDADLDDDDYTPVVMYRNIDTQKWVLVNEVTRNSDNTLTMCFDGLGSVLFLGINPQGGSSESGESSRTGDTGVKTLAIALAATVAVLAVIVIIKRRSSDEK